jgi:hypothetical protein
VLSVLALLFVVGGWVVFAFSYFIGIVGYILILASDMILFSLKIKLAIRLGFLGWFFKAGTLFAYIVIIGEIGIAVFILLFTTFSILIINIFALKYRNISPYRSFEMVREELATYLKKLPSIYPEMSLKDILLRMKLDKSYIEKLIKLIEDLIYDGELEAKLIGKRLVFPSSTYTPINPQNPYNQPSEPNIAPQTYERTQQGPYSRPMQPNIASHTYEYYQSKKSKYLIIGIISIISGIILFIIGITGIFIYIPVFSELYIGEFLGAALIFLGVRYVKKTQ